MIYDKKSFVRKQDFLSQPLKKSGISRSAVNAWEMVFFTPTTQYVVDMAKLFHVTSDYLLGIVNEHAITVESYTEEEMNLLYGLIKYIDSQKKEFTLYIYFEFPLISLPSPSYTLAWG